MSNVNQEPRKSVASNTVTMDSRKFLSTINNSAESQIKFLGESVSRMGSEQNKNWALSATANERIIIEDVDSGGYLLADYSRQKNGQIKIGNVRPIEITEGEKSPHFEAACRDLVEGLQTNDSKATEAAFSRIAASRFRSTAVPNSGLVKTRDGTVRYISVRSDVMNEDIQDRLVGIIANELSDKVIISEGEVSGIFNSQKFRLPVTPLMERRVVAYNMRERARNSYWNQEFQDLAHSAAGHICEGIGGVKKVVPAVGAFLQKHQEFNLLNRAQLNEVVTNALAAKGVFNEVLAEDTATLIYKTGLKVNRPDILDAWKQTSKKAEHDVMLENVTKLEAASEADFPAMYDQFLDKVFMTEAIGETTRQGLANALELLKEKIQDPGAQAQIEDLSSRLRNPSTADDQAVWDTMNLMAKTNNQMDNMDQFDAIPGSEAPTEDPSIAPPVDVPPAAPAAPAAPAQTVININTGGGTPSITGAPEAPVTPPAPPSDDLSGALDDINLESGGETPGEPGAELPPEAAAGGPPPEEKPLQVAGLERTGTPLNEDDQAQLDVAMDKWFTENVGDAETVTEGVAGINLMAPQAPLIDPNYGVQLLRENVVNQKLMDIDKLARDKNLKPEELTEHLDELAGTALAGDPALKDPAAMQKAKEQLIGAYTTQQALAKRATAGAPTVAENQIKSPIAILSRRGLKKAAINKLVTENKLEWLNRNPNAVLGKYKDVMFTIDNVKSPLVLLNHDGSVEIPIPESLAAGALYFSEMSNDESEADTFVEWLDQNIEQLRPITEAEEKLVQEALAKLTVSPDVEVTIAVEGGAAPVAPAAPLITEPEPPVVPSEEPVSEVPVEGPVEEAPGELPGEVAEEPGDDEVEEDEDLEEALKKIFSGKPISD